jgi:hypothetical protein
MVKKKKGEWLRICKEAVMAYLKLLFRDSFVKTEDATNLEQMS